MFDLLFDKLFSATGRWTLGLVTSGRYRPSSKSDESKQNVKVEAVERLVGLLVWFLALAVATGLFYVATR